MNGSTPTQACRAWERGGGANGWGERDHLGEKEIPRNAKKPRGRGWGKEKYTVSGKGEGEKGDSELA